MFKRIFAIIGLIVIFLWIAATVIVAFIPFPGKTFVFGLLAAGCVLLPLMFWIILWVVSSLTGKDNIATFRTKAMNETMMKAEMIKNAQKDKSESQTEE